MHRYTLVKHTKPNLDWTVHHSKQEPHNTYITDKTANLSKVTKLHLYFLNY